MAFKKNIFLWENDFWRDGVLLQMRWSGRKDVFRVQCTGAMKHWPNSWWRYESLYTSLDFGTNNQGWTWKHVDVSYIRQDWVTLCFFFVFFDRPLLFIPLKRFLLPPFFFPRISFHLVSDFVVFVCRYMEILHGATHFTQTSFLAWERWRQKLLECLAHFSMVDQTPVAQWVII